MNGIEAVAVAQAIVNVERRQRARAAAEADVITEARELPALREKADAPVLVGIAGGVAFCAFVWLVGFVDVVRSLVGWVASW